MKTTATKSQINLLIMLIGILLAVASYFFVFTKFNEKRAALAAENATLQTEVDALQELADNKEFYISETQRMDTEIRDIIARYPADVKVEDQVLYTYAVESSNQIWVNGLNVLPKEQVMVVAPTPTPEAAPAEDDLGEEVAAEPAAAPAAEAAAPAPGIANSVYLYTSPFTMQYKSTYTSIKDVVRSIVESDDRMSIKTLTIGYDADTGCLAGNVDATMYTMEGTDATYTAPTVIGVPQGTPDIFRSGTVLSLSTGGSGTVVEGEGESADTTAESTSTAE